MSTAVKTNLASDIPQSGAIPVRAARVKRPRRSSSLGPKLDESVATPIRRLPSVDFSFLLFCYIALTLFMGLAAANSQANLLFAIFGIMLGIMLITYMICRSVLTRLRVHRLLPDQASVGQPITIQYQFFNAKRLLPSLSVLLSELDGAEAFAKQPFAYMFHAAPGMTAVVPIETVPKRRGLHELDAFQISTSFPFGFLRMAANRRQHDTLLIYPPIGEVSPRLLAMCRSADRGGANMKPRPNGADEFYGVKEYRAGENPRWIYWKRSARTGQLVAKQMAVIAPPNLFIMVDTFIARRTLAEHTAVEKAIAMAASLASQALESGMAVGLCVWANGWTIITPERGKRHCRDILAALAGLPLNQTADIDQLAAQVTKLYRYGVTPVLFTQQKIQFDLGEQVRNAMLVVTVESPQAKAWFHFGPDVDFSRGMPANQQPTAEQLATASEPPVS